VTQSPCLVATGMRDTLRKGNLFMCNELAVRWFRFAFNRIRAIAYMSMANPTRVGVAS
jgi:hypothetical protein